VTRSCDDRIELGAERKRLAGSSDVRVGPVVFSLLKLDRSPSTFKQVGRHGKIYALKAPLFVRHDETATVAISGRTDASLFYSEGNFPGTVRAGVRAVKFVACPVDEPARTYHGRIGVATEFSGGILLARPACVTVQVWVGASTRPLTDRLALGKNC
jgi:hypothetical protein